MLIGGGEPTAEQDEQEEEQPGNDVGHNEAAADGAHEAEEGNGCLMRQEADQEEGEVPAKRAQADWQSMLVWMAACYTSLAVACMVDVELSVRWHRESDRGNSICRAMIPDA